jgi:hypothetical protein
LWRDLDNVGVTKAQGNMPIDTLIYIMGVEDLNALARAYRDRGLETLYSKEDQPSMCVWDRRMMQDLIDENRELLEREGWPTDADRFVKKVARVVAKPGPLYDFIAKTFDDVRYRSSD